MAIKEIRRAQLVKGGDIIKQGETFTLGFLFFDANDRIIQLESSDGVTVKIANNTGVILETTAEKIEDRVEFSVNENIGYGEMRVEFTVTIGSEVQKYPASDWIRLKITPSLDDTGIGNVYAVTATEMFSRISGAEQTATIADQKATSAETTANTVKQGYDDIIADAGNSNPEIVDARRGETTLGNQVDLINNKVEERAQRTTGVVNKYVNATSGNDSTGNGTSAAPFKTIQKAIDSLPAVIVHDVVINIANGTYTDIGATSEWGQPQIASFHGKIVRPTRNNAIPTNTKAAKITLQGESMAGVILDGALNSIRTGIYANSKDILLKKITVKNCNTGIIAHQGGDISAYELDVTQNGTGVSVESDARFECGYSNISGNTTDIYSKNGQLQINDTVINGLVTIEGSPYQVFERCSGSIKFDLKGCDYLDLKTCDFFGGTNFIQGYFTYIRISADTHIHEYTSNVFVPATGLINVLDSHIWGNNFVVFVSEGNGNIRFSNCDSKNKEGIDTPNTQSTPFRMYNQGTVDFINSNILPNAVLQRPASGMVLKGSSPPTTGYHEKGKIMLNEGAALGQRAAFSSISAGTPGTWEGFGQIGHRTRTASPVGQVAPFFIGEEILDATNKVWWKSVGTASADWRQMTT